ncbi:putative ribonuclease H-like domain-containing protein [Tanacetum coccineum]
MRPFGCLVIILNTIDHLGKFDRKADEGFFVGYSINSKAFRVFNSRTRIVEENMHVQFSENTPNIAGSRPNWLFDIDALTKSMNYKPVVVGNQSNGNAGTKASDDVVKSSPDARFKPSEDDEKKVTEEPGKEGGDSSKDSECSDQGKEDNVNITNNINSASTNEVNAVGAKTSIELPDDPNMPEFEDIVYSDDDEDVGTEADMKNLDVFMPISPIQTTRIHKDHPVKQIIGDLSSAPQTRRMTKNLEEHGLFSLVQQRTNHKDFQNYLFACFLSQEEPKKTLEDLPNERGIVIKNKAILVAQGYTQEEGIDYDEVFALMDVKSAFLYDDIIFGSTKKSLCTEFEKMMHKKFQISYMGELTFFLGLQVKQKKDRIFISQDKYMTEILKKFGFTDVKTATTPMETQKVFLKDEDGEEVDVYSYRSMIGSLMYLTSSRPDIMFAVCACARYQVNPKISHLHAVKRYLKGQLKLGLWYPKDSPFDLIAYTDSDYARAILDRKSTTGDLFTKAFDNRIGVNAGDSKLMLLGINLPLLEKVNAARHKLTTAVEMDGKKIIITEAYIRSDLQLNDEGGMNCLPNATIFEELTRMGYEKLSQKLTFYKAFFSPQWKFLIDTILQCLSAKTTAWNEFSSTMASAIICLATNQKFNFSKYIFESMVKNLDSVGKFLMYPRFVQVFFNKQVNEISKHNGIYVTPSHTKKIFGNMKRVGKGFSGSVTPLFPTMVVQAQEEMGEGSAMPTDPHHTPTIIQPSTSQPQKKQKPRKPRKDTQIPQSSGPTDNVADEAVNKEMDDSLERAVTTAIGLDAE